MLPGQPAGLTSETERAEGFGVQPECECLETQGARVWFSGVL